MKTSTHLLNQVASEIGHMRSTEDFAWDHRVAQRVLEVVEAHAECTYCNGGA